MSIWNKLIAHPGFQRFQTIYNDQFPLEVRYLCAHWIEKRIETDKLIDINDPQIIQIAANFLHSLIQMLQHEKQKLIRNEQLSIKYRIDQAIDTFTHNLNQPFAIYKQIRDTMSYEQHLIESENQPMNCSDQEAIEINEKLKILQNQVLTNKEKQSKYKHEIEQFKVLDHRETITRNFKTSDTLEQERLLVVLEEYTRMRSQMIESINTRSVDLNQSFVNMVVDIDSIQTVVILKRLGKWHRDQASAGNGTSLNPNILDEIQSWFEKLADIISNTRCSIEDIRVLNTSISMNVDVILQVYADITILLQNLFISGFIIEKQPPRVIKTNVIFAATTRLLIANLGVQLNNAPVVASILSESQCQQQQKTYNMGLAKSSGSILNNTGYLDIQQSTRHLSCHLKNMTLNKIKRTERRGRASVTDEKFALHFKSTFQTADIQINVWVMSLPVVVVVHTNQEPDAWATITWDNAFSDISRVPFHVADRGNWSEMAVALNMKFASETGRGLTVDHLNYLFEKVFGAAIDHNDRTISWSQFCKVPLPGRWFSFWEWFYAIMKLTKDHFRVEWTEGSIIGFVNKQRAENELLKCRPGTFLLRFSDSEIGGITVAWVDIKSNVVMLHPFCHKDLEIISLSDRISYLRQCITLYPDTPKDKAFRKQYSPKNAITVDGYVKSFLKITVPDAHFISKPNILQLFSVN